MVASVGVYGASIPTFGNVASLVSTPGENLTDPPIENLTVDQGDEPQVVATS